MPDTGDVTRLLTRLSPGARAVDEVLPLVYEELRRIARRQLSRERSDHTLQPTALVHEAYLRISSLDRIEWSSREHFFAVAARAMRRILVDHALQRRAQKRGGGRTAVPLEEHMLVTEQESDRVLALHDALVRLEQLEPRLCRVVECRYFAGLTITETADALGISAATAKRDWAVARAWLNRELNG